MEQPVPLSPGDPDDLGHHFIPAAKPTPASCVSSLTNVRHLLWLARSSVPSNPASTTTPPRAAGPGAAQAKSLSRQAATVPPRLLFRRAPPPLNERAGQPPGEQRLETPPSRSNFGCRRARW